MQYYGDFVEDDVVYLVFNTFSSDDPSASCTITNFTATDVHIHKDNGLTQRNNAAGITVSVDFDGITGSHMIAIDTNDNTVAGFWVTGSDYFVRIEGTTVDAGTINAVIGHFSIENRFMRGTNSAALAATALTDATWTDAKAVNIDANISSRNATTPPTVTAIRTEMDTNSTKMAPSQTLADYKATGFNTVTPDAEGVAPTAAEIKTILEAAGSSLAQILADTGTTLPARFTGVEGVTFDTGTDSLEAIRNRGDAEWSAAAGNPNVLVDTTVASLSSQTVFVIAAGSTVNDAYKDQAIVLYDASNSDSPSVRKVSGYTGASKTITLDSAPDFTMIAGDGVKTFVTAPGTTAPTAAEVRIEMDTHSVDLNAILTDTNDLQTNQGAWATATGFNTTVPDVAGTAATLHGVTDGKVDVIDGIVDAIVIDTAGLNGDVMRGTDSANTTTPPTVIAIRTEMDTNSTKMAPSQVLGDYKATGFNTVIPDVAGTAATLHGITDGKVDVVDGIVDAIVIDTAGLNGDAMRGTNNANTTVPDAAGTAATLHGITDGKVDVVDGVVDDILVDTGTTIPASITLLNDITVAEIIAGVADGALDLQEILRVILSAVAGKSSGGGTSTLAFRDYGDAKARITATVDANGNRTGMVIDGS